jgi:transketolase
MRNTFANCLVKAAQSDNKVVLLTGDHGYALFDEFRKLCPSQYFNAGIAEQNMIGVSAGLAKTGFKPIVYGLSAFIPIRVLEQIKIDLCYENLPVILIGDGAGIVYSALGTSHQSTEDIAALRGIPNIIILSPADAFEMRACFKLAQESEQTVYIRVGKADLGSVHDMPVNLKMGQIIPVKKEAKTDIVFIGTGSMVLSALEIASKYSNSSVWSAPCLKPIDKKQIVEVILNSKVIVTLEEHSIYGGLGSIISEIASEFNVKLPICTIGINDKFSTYCGNYKYLLEEHELDIPSIERKINDFFLLHNLVLSS